MANLVQSALKLLTDLKEDGISSVVVMFSGGKESRVCLDMSVRVFGAENVHAVFLYAWPNLRCEREQYSIAERRYGITPIQLPHPTLGDIFRSGEFRSVRPSTQAKVRRRYRWADVEKIVRSRTGSYWIVAGHRTADSLQRAAMIKSRQGRWDERGRIYPLWQWQIEHVLSYLRARKISLPSNFNAGLVNTSGVDFGNPKCLAYLRDHYPDDFEKLTRVFPDCVSLLEREEVRDRHQIKFKKAESEVGEQA